MFRKIGYGLVLWVIPYVTAIPLLPLMQRDLVFFKTIMIVEGTLVGAVLTAAYFLRVERNFLREGVVLAAVWILLNWALDFAALLPFTKMPLDRYFIEIGARYLAMAAPTVVAGFLLERRAGTLS